jgi:hypothetical protein
MSATVLEGVLIEREEKIGRGNRNKMAALKVSRQYLLVLLVEAKLVFGICSILIFKDVGAAVVGEM